MPSNVAGVVDTKGNPLLQPWNADLTLLERVRHRAPTRWPSDPLLRASTFACR